MAGTLIETTKGAQAIETIRVGDYVLSKSDETGEVGILSVEAVHVHAHQPTIVVTVCSRDGALPIETTPEHPFRVSGRGWLGANELWIGAVIENTHGTLGKVCGLRSTGHYRTVFNLTTSPWHSFVIAGGWWVHNTGSSVRPATAFRAMEVDAAGRPVSGTSRNQTMMRDSVGGRVESGLSANTNADAIPGRIRTNSNIAIFSLDQSVLNNHPELMAGPVHDNHFEIVARPGVARQAAQAALDGLPWTPVPTSGSQAR